MTELFTLDINGESWKVLMIVSEKPKDGLLVLLENMRKIEKHYGSLAALHYGIAVLSMTKLIMDVISNSINKKEGGSND